MEIGDLCLMIVTFNKWCINNSLIYKGIDLTASWLNRLKSVLKDLLHKNPRRTQNYYKFHINFHLIYSDPATILTNHLIKVKYYGYD